MQFNFLFPELSQSATMCLSPSAWKSGRQTTPLARGSDDHFLLKIIFILNSLSTKWWLTTVSMRSGRSVRTRRRKFHSMWVFQSSAIHPLLSHVFIPQTMESQCWKAKEIWYEKCREVSKPINMMCWSCVVNSHPKNEFYDLSLSKTINCPELYELDGLN